MKTLTIICSITLSVCAFADEPATPTLVKPANKESGTAKKPSVLQRVGGFVIDYSTAKGVYLFVDCQERLDTKLIHGMAKALKGDFAWNIESVAGNDEVKTTKQAIAEKERLGALAATFLVDSDTLPLLTIAPEANVAVINVNELVADKPKPILEENRLVRETMRAFAFSLGSGYTSYEGVGVMHPIKSASDLDRLSANFMPPDCANAAMQTGTKIGFKPYRRTTYKRACREGWAPAPTNEFQRAIWNQVHAIPDKPMTIEFDPKKDK